MCVAIFKPAGVEPPAVEVLQKCWTSNPDGAGFTVPSEKKGLIEVFKGYMTFDTFKNAFVKKASKDAPMLIHFRIGTSGTKDGRCTHPFPVSEDYNVLTKSHSVCRYALVHNGILPIDGRSALWSDTMEFTAIVAEGHFCDDMVSLQKLISPLLEGNKVAILSGTGDVVLCGKWQSQDGVYYSNLSWSYVCDYKSVSWCTNPYKGWNYGTYGGNYGAYNPPKIAYTKIGDDIEVLTSGVWIGNHLFRYTQIDDEEYVFNEVCPYCGKPLKVVHPIKNKKDLQALKDHFKGIKPEFFSCSKCPYNFIVV